MNRRAFIASFGAATISPRLALAQAPSTPGGYDGPLFDAHYHMQSPQEIRPPNVMALWRQHQITGLALFFNSTREQMVLMLQQRFSQFFYPFAQVPLNPTQPLALDDAALNTTERELRTGVMHGIGEVPLRHRALRTSIPVDGAGAQKLFALAARYRVPVNIHVEHVYAAEVDRALAQNPTTKIIWAHMGDGPASMMLDLMQKHPNLYAGGQFAERLKQLDNIVLFTRIVLGQLTKTTAEAIAYKNARTLLGIAA